MHLRSLLLAVTVALTSVTVNAAPRPGYPRGFAYADGENFAIDGQKFYYFGTNAYWFSFLSVCITG
jgi:hypothetical protein